MANVWVNNDVWKTSFDMGDALTWASLQLEFFSQCYKKAASGTMVAEFPRSPKKGRTIRIRYPGAVTYGDAFEGAQSANDITQNEASLTIEHHLWSRHDLTGEEMTLNLDDFNQFVMKPHMEYLAQTLDTYVASKYKGIYATDTAAFTAVANVTGLDDVEPHVSNLDAAGAPTSQRYAILTPKAYNVAASQDSFARADARGGGGPLAAERGVLLPSFDVDFYKAKGVGLGVANTITALDADNRHVTGAFWNGSTLIDGAVLAGATTMTVDAGAVSSDWEIGDMFQVADVDGTYAVTNTGTSDGAGEAVGIEFTPAAPTGGFPDGKAVTAMGDHVKGILAAPGALVAAAVPPTVVPGQASAFIADPEGFSFGMNWHHKAADGSGAAVTFEVFAAAVLARPEFASMVPTPYV